MALVLNGEEFRCVDFLLVEGRWYLPDSHLVGVIWLLFL